MIRFATGLLIMLVLGLTVGCSTSTALPEPNVTIGEISIPTILGTHCWREGRTAWCEDYSAPPELVANSEYQPVKVAGGSAMVVTWTVEPRPGTASISQWAGEQAEPVYFVADSITLPQEPGLYTYAVFARWPRGDASYAFRVLVTEP